MEEIEPFRIFGNKTLENRKLFSIFYIKSVEY